MLRVAQRGLRRGLVAPFARWSRGATAGAAAVGGIDRDARRSAASRRSGRWGEWVAGLMLGLAVGLIVAVEPVAGDVMRSSSRDAVHVFEPRGFPSPSLSLRDEADADAQGADPIDDDRGRLREPQPYTVTLFTENDGGFLKPNNLTDRYYTAGNGASLTFHPAWADRLADWLYDEPFRQPRANAAGFFAGQLMFTPEDLSNHEVIEDDRPYAGYFYFGTFWQSATDYALDHVRLEVGTVGAISLAGETQKWVHAVFGGDRPRGWSNQIKNEPTIQAFYHRRWKLTDESFGVDHWPGEFEVLPGIGLALGTVRRHVEAGLAVRYGVNLPTDFGPARLDDLSGTAKTYDPGFGTYLFARASGRAVQHDLFIQGSDFRNSHGVEVERFVGRVQGGAQLYYRHPDWILEVGYSQTYITPQFAQQRGSHAYASLTLAMTMWF